MQRPLEKNRTPRSAGCGTHQRIQKERLAAFEGVAVLRLDGGGYATAQRDGVNGVAFAETSQDCQLGGQHVAFVDGSEGALGFMVNAFGGIGDEHARGVDHSGRSGFALCLGRF
jgi:hypothetical protein